MGQRVCSVVGKPCWNQIRWSTYCNFNGSKFCPQLFIFILNSIKLHSTKCSSVQFLFLSASYVSNMKEVGLTLTINILLEGLLTYHWEPIVHRHLPHLPDDILDDCRARCDGLCFPAPPAGPRHGHRLFCHVDQNQPHLSDLWTGQKVGDST